MAKIDSRGLVDDGTNSLTVAGSVSVVGSVSYTANVLVGSGSVTIPTAGFFQVPASGSSGAGFFTGSVPNANSVPGAMLIVADTYGVFDWCLTGSALNISRPVFSLLSGTFLGAVGSKGQGTNLRVPKSGSVALVSDGSQWLVMAGTGSLLLTGLPVSSP